MKAFSKFCFMLFHAVFILLIEAYCLSTVCFNPFQWIEDVVVIVVFFVGIAIHCLLLVIAEKNNLIDSPLFRFLLIVDLLVPSMVMIFLSTAVNYPSIGMALFVVGIQIVIISTNLIMLSRINSRWQSRL